MPLSFFSVCNLLFTWCEELTHWKRPWCWEKLKAGGEGEDRGWDGWVASSTQWTWVWANSGSWWWTGKPGMLQSMGLQRVRHNWTEFVKQLFNKYVRGCCLKMLISTYKHFSGSSAGKESACNVEDLSSIPGLGRSAWRREWLLIPVFLPGKPHGLGSLLGYSPWGCKESDTTEWLTQHL